MNVLRQFIYEIDKGIRDLALHTVKGENLADYCDYLKKENIDFALQKIDNNKINIFLGKKECVDIVNTFIHKHLNALTPAEDFILGIMLGYSRFEQCKRYLKKHLLKN